MKKYDYMNPKAIHKNRLKARAQIIPYANETQAMADIVGASPYYKQLNGRWQFAYCDNPTLAYDEYFSRDYDDIDWDSIPVPCNWQMLGYDKFIGPISRKSITSTSNTFSHLIDH